MFPVFLLGTRNVVRKMESKAKIAPQEMRLFGRKIIYADYREDEMNETTITKILNDVFSVHTNNALEIDYLEKYYKGFQPILGKVKEIRPTINNTVVENNAYYITEFKKSYVFGEPIQYVQRGEVANPQVSLLNGYMLAEDKFPKDTELAESLYISGIAHRIILPNKEGEAPLMLKIWIARILLLFIQVIFLIKDCLLLLTQ